MKKLYGILAALLLGASAPAASTPARAQSFPTCYDGTMTPVSLAPPAALPDSLVPLFVSHIGRHGARFITSEKKVMRLRNTLALSSGITPAGRELQRIVEEVIDRTDGRWGDLDSLGHAEQRTIAANLNAILPGFFSSGSVSAISSLVPRCVESMYSFCGELGRLNPGLDVGTSAGPAYNDLLRFFEFDKTYHKFLTSGKWLALYEPYAAATLPTAVADRTLGPNGLSAEQKRQFAADVYFVLRSLPAMGMTVPPSAEHIIAESEYEACFNVYNYEKALQRTDAFSSLPGKSARPLLDVIVNEVDMMLAAPAALQTVRATFRFAHDNTVMPLFALMGLPGCTLPPKTLPANVSKIWDCGNVAPLGANLEIIIAKGPSGQIYGVLYLNGNQIPPKPGASAVTPWQTLAKSWR